MFPLNDKCHDMHTRCSEKYKVQFALNNRLQNSPVTYMQRLLNENNQDQENKPSWEWIIIVIVLPSNALYKQCIFMHA